MIATSENSYNQEGALLHNASPAKQCVKTPKNNQHPLNSQTKINGNTKRAIKIPLTTPEI